MSGSVFSAIVNMSLGFNLSFIMTPLFDGYIVFLRCDGNTEPYKRNGGLSDGIVRSAEIDNLILSVIYYYSILKLNNFEIKRIKINYY